MRQHRLAASIALVGLVLSGCDSQTSVALDTPAQKASYGIGLNMGQSLARDGLDEVRAAARIDAQAPEEFYRTHCNTLLVNNGSAEQFREDCRRFCRKLLGKDTIDHE